MKMTREEREAWKAARGNRWRQDAEADKSIDINTPQGRLQYIRFVSEASAFCRARKPVRFHGEHWKL